MFLVDDSWPWQILVLCVATGVYLIQLGLLVVLIFIELTCLLRLSRAKHITESMAVIRIIIFIISIHILPLVRRRHLILTIRFLTIVVTGLWGSWPILKALFHLVHHLSHHDVLLHNHFWLAVDGLLHGFHPIGHVYNLFLDELVNVILFRVVLFS